MKNVAKVLFVLILVSGLNLGLTLSNAVYGQQAGEQKGCKAMFCTVCKTDIPMDAPKITVEYKEKTYFFATEQCKTEFEKNPEKYAACSEHEHKTVYACPMKECDYKTGKAGKCPKCGMELKESKECLLGEPKELGCMKTCPFMKAKEEEEKKKNETAAK